MARRGQPFGPALIADVVVERGHLGDEIRFPLGIDRLDGEPAGRRGQQVVATVGIAACLADLGECAHTGERRHALRAGLASVADQHHAEWLARCRGTGGSSPDSDPRRCGAAGRSRGKAPGAAGRAGSPSPRESSPVRARGPDGGRWACGARRRGSRRGATVGRPARPRRPRCRSTSVGAMRRGSGACPGPWRGTSRGRPGRAGRRRRRRGVAHRDPDARCATTGSPPTWNGWSSAVEEPRCGVLAVGGSGASTSRSPNSSPPSRATTSVARTHDRSRSATAPAARRRRHGRGRRSRP